MYMLTGDLYKPDDLLEDLSVPIVLNSAGHYRLITQKDFRTIRPLGRKDYQLIYVAKGYGRFIINDEEVIIGEGNIIFYEPDMGHNYCYFLEDTPDIFWVHFSGYDVIPLLNRIGFGDGRIFRVGTHSDYAFIINKIIYELQLQQEYYEELTTGLFMELIHSMARGLKQSKQNNSHYHLEEIAKDFQLNYNKNFEINSYAKSLNMSPGWLIRSFKLYSGWSPQAYITNIRINKARELLINSQYNVNEIATIVGYQNPLYFSRLFKKYTGLSPKSYRDNASQGYELTNVNI